MDGVGYWGSLPRGDTPTVWVEKLRELKEGPRILFCCGGPREWGVPMSHCVTVHSPHSTNIHTFKTHEILIFLGKPVTSLSFMNVTINVSDFQLNMYK